MTSRNYYSGAKLSKREAEVLQYVACGLTNPQIGQRLFVSEETIKTHMLHIFRKFGARNRAHAVSIGYEKGVLECSTTSASGLADGRPTPVHTRLVA